MEHDPISRAVTDLILETFRLNGTLIGAGDELVADLGLTSARWQVLGAIRLEERDLTVAQIARRMGLTRQSVQRVVKDLEKNGFVRLVENPDHRTAKLVQPTKKGNSAYDQAHDRQVAWARALGEGMDIESLVSALETLRFLNTRADAGLHRALAASHLRDG
mgnify:CR=1 FL=1